uniref:Uncharacterized protein n=1 Tax=Astyanax mexicanus TaxID=7994 RepID=A0A8B9L5J0_ASTMX
MALEQFSDVVQRCQAVQDEKFSPADFDLFQTAGKTCIEQGDSAQVLSIIVDERNKCVFGIMRAQKKCILHGLKRTCTTCTNYLVLFT